VRVDPDLPHDVGRTSSAENRLRIQADRNVSNSIYWKACGDRFIAAFVTAIGLRRQPG
jgi:hypothetical protein